jgi:aerobic carbon-monoxide dehydrogenase large subunit
MTMSTTAGVGASLRRLEDHRLLTGAGAFTDDLSLPGQLHAAVVRSPYAHARLRGVDASAARGAPGVVLVLTAADLRQEGVRAIPSLSRTPPFDIRGPDGQTAPDADQYPLADDKVRYAGEPVALVVADTAARARDAAADVAVDYEPLEAVVDAARADDPGAPRVWDDRPSNRSFAWERGDAAAVAEAFAAAAHVVSVELVNNRIAPVFLEPRAALAERDAATGRLTLRAGCQSPHGMRAVLAGALGVEARDIRVIAPDMGGGFGARGGLYPEYVALLVAARRLGRPVKWTADRAESFLTDHQSRDHVLRGELALDAAGRFTAMRASVDWRHGAYLTTRSVWVLVHYLPPMLGGPYRIPLGYVAIRGAFSNTTPQGAIRGIGRLEANYLTESLIEAAARASGIDRVELRRRNLLTAADLPWTTVGGNVLTSGAFAGHLDRALERVDWAGFAARRRADADQRRLRGIGLALYVENDGSTNTEFAEIEVIPAGRVLVLVGTQDFGMGHATMYTQVAVEALGVAPEQVDVVFGDTDRVARGSGSHGSRTARMGGGAVVTGATKLIEEGRALAAGLVEAAPEDVVYAGGRFTVAGTDRGVSLFEVAAARVAQGGRFAAQADFVTAGDAHASGCHACEVSIDPGDGRVVLERYAIVADVGRAVNPPIVHGQMHGGAAQGIGQALLEELVVAPDSGQVLAGSLMDYAVPRADDLPAFSVDLVEDVEPDNPLGVKGAGENATTGAPAAVLNAIRDALASAGVEQVDMPVTSEQVWEALRRAAPAPR